MRRSPFVVIASAAIVFACSAQSRSNHMNSTNASDGSNESNGSNRSSEAVTRSAPSDSLRPGDSCTSEIARCFDSRTELNCENGKVIATPCKGDGGCQIKGGERTCDISANRENELCPAHRDREAACTTGGRARVVCAGGKYQIEFCRGPSGCQTTPKHEVSCDSSHALAGDACDQEGGVACSVEGNRVLTCKSGKYMLDEHCRGPKHCHLEEGKVACDRGDQQIGDTCSHDGDYECSAAGFAIVVCRSGTWQLKRKCPKRCGSSGTAVWCER